MPETATAPFTLAVDVGGTFVDVTLCDLESGQRWVRKVLSDEGPTKAFIDGVKAVCSDADISTGQLTRIVHGTTLATNAILQMTSDRTVVVVSRGMRDLLEIGRHDAPRGGNRTSWLKRPRPVPRHQIVELAERIEWDGSQLESPSGAALANAVESIRALKPASVAVCLLHSANHHDHELLVRQVLDAAMPNLHVALSHEVLPQLGEYERLMATVLNAYTMAAVSDYLVNLEVELHAIGAVAPLYIMSSDGGVLSAEDARRFPIHTALSGPAGGASGAAELSRELEEPRIFTLDVGGTSTDVATAENGAVAATVTGTIGDFPIALPVLDVHTVGAGGGSIASFQDGRFEVGPRSAGAQPGPACYGRGGQEPTVTDALLVMGWLPDTLAGGALRLSRTEAEAAIYRAVATPLGVDLVEAAAGIVRLANAHMAHAIRHISTERGRDPREYALVAFGGAGGLHAIDVAEQIGIPRVIIPVAPGVFTTEGLLAADLSRSFVHSFPAPRSLTSFSVDELESTFDQLERRATAWLDSGAFARERQLTRHADLRYEHQGFELIIPSSEAQVTPGGVAQMEEHFHAEHDQRYRYRLGDVGIEAVRIRTAAVGILAHAARPVSAGTDHDGTRELEDRDVYFDQAGWMRTKVVERSSLNVGNDVAGPAIIEEYDSTTIVPPHARATVSENGAMVICINERGRAESSGFIP
jgi:N-methylhydantoinase A